MRYVVFDIETTGLNAKLDRIIEIGAIKVEDGIVLEEFDYFINPGVSIPPEVSEINHIFDDMVADADLPGVVLSKFMSFIQDADYIIGHNAKRFDYPFIENECLRHFVKFQPTVVKDTVWVARSKIKGLRSYSLAALCRVFNVENINAHRALSDVYATHYVYLELLKR
jgi:DNA polymerase III epsilon subunit family exonuclease